MAESGDLLAQRYRLGECLGEGGSAKVFRARDEHLSRDVALKLLHDHVLPSDRRRFEREIRALSRIEHPHIVSIYDLGRDAQGRLFFTMPLLLGGSICAVGPIEDRPSSLGRFVQVVLDVLSAVAHFHRSGLVHRDLTAQNILLGEDGRPRVMDFGLVYLPEGTRDLTRTGYTLGTPHYMSPEQAKGGAAGPASDLYALGVVLYQVATGRLPFIGDSDQSLLYQHVYEPPVPPLEVNPLIPAALSELLLSLLDKDPARRPASAEGFAARLEQFWVDERSDRLPSRYRGGLSRCGDHALGPRLPAHLEELWQLQLPGETTWPAAVVASASYLVVGTRRGSVSLADHFGHLVRDITMPDEVAAPVAVQGSRLYAACWDGSVRCFSVDGVPRWTYRTRAEITSSPTLWRNLVLVGSRDGHLHSLDQGTGQLQWAYAAGAPVASSPVLAAGTALLADESGWIHGLDADSGQPLWKFALDPVHATPALTGSSEVATLTAATWRGEVHAVRLLARSGHLYPDGEQALLWTYDVEAEIWASPAVYARAVCVGDWQGQLHCLDLESGDPTWERQLTGRITASPVIAQGAVYVATEEGWLYALDLRDGTSLWECRLPQGVQATPLPMRGRLYAVSLNGSLRAFSERD